MAKLPDLQVHLDERVVVRCLSRIGQATDFCNFGTGIAESLQAGRELAGAHTKETGHTTGVERFYYNGDRELQDAQVQSVRSLRSTEAERP